MVFPFNNQRKRKPMASIKINGNNINFGNQVNYLGIQLDAKLLFGAHVNNICAKASRCIAALYPLISWRSKLFKANKMLLYKCIIRPMLTYSSPVWSSTAAIHRKKKIRCCKTGHWNWSKTCRAVTRRICFIGSQKFNQSTNFCRAVTRNFGQTVPTLNTIWYVNWYNFYIFFNRETIVFSFNCINRNF